MWHFVAADRKLGYGDGRLVKPGVTYKVDCEPELCERGLHASKRLIDALRYAPGPVLCKVRLGGAVVHGEDKAAATERTVLAVADVSDILREFARKTAWDVWRQHHTTDPDDAKYGIVVRWLKTGDETLRSAAWSAAWSAAELAAESAANRRLTAMVRKAKWETK